MVTITIKQIIGGAGTGKTTYAKKVARCHIKQRKDVHCLSLTHSSVENMRRRGFPEECNFSTIHSFFRIDPEGNVAGCYRSFDVLIIDEFSLISSSILVSCIKNIYKAAERLAIGDCQIYLLGDPIQLSAVDTNDSIEFSVLERALNVLPISEIPVERLTPIIKHWSRLCINHPFIRDLTSRSLTLTTNHRSDDSIMQLVERIITKGDYTDIFCNLHTTDEVVRMVKDEGFTVIASQYNTLKLINERVRSGSYLTYHDWRYIAGENVYMTVSTASLFNGEIVKLIDATDTSITIENDNGKDIISDLYLKFLQETDVRKSVPIALPEYLYTFHKSQGLEFDNVAICVDRLFEFPMLYTGITRARKRVIFFTMNSGLLTEIDSLFDRPINRAFMQKFYSESPEDDTKRMRINEIASQYINNGSIEIGVIKNIYTKENLG